MSRTLSSSVRPSEHERWNPSVRVEACVSCGLEDVYVSRMRRVLRVLNLRGHWTCRGTETCCALYAEDRPKEYSAECCIHLGFRT